MQGKAMAAAEPPFGRVVMGSHGSALPHFVERLPDGMSACNIVGVWYNPSNKIYVNITATPTPGTFTASCIGSVGWKRAVITVTGPTAGYPQGRASLDVPSTAENTTGLLSTFAGAGAPVCSQLEWADKNMWALTPWANSSTPAAPGIPKMQAFSEGNGNEHRLSYKGYAQEFALLIESPVSFSNNAMIINTNKRLTDDKSPGPIGGPLPTNSISPPNADYRCVHPLA